MVSSHGDYAQRTIDSSELHFMSHLSCSRALCVDEACVCVVVTGRQERQILKIDVKGNLRLLIGRVLYDAKGAILARAEIIDQYGSNVRS